MKKQYLPALTGCLAVFCLMASNLSTFAQQGSQGNTTIFGGAQMTVFGAHNFANGGSGVQPGIVNTIRTAPYGVLNFGTAATSSGASDAAHVDGYVQKFGTTSFVFPVGDNGQYGPFAAAADGTTGAYFHVDPSSAITSMVGGGNYPVLPTGGPFATSSKATDVTTVSTKEYWDIDGTNATKITLTWDAISDVTTLTGSSLTKLGIVGWNGAQWVKIPATVDATSILGGTSSLTAGSITTNTALAPNTYTAYTLASVVNAVPDLTPAQFFSNSSLNVGDSMDYVLTVSNVGPVATSGLIEFFVSRFGSATGLTITLSTASSLTIDGDEFILNNNEFDITTTTGRFSFASKAGVSIPSLGYKNIGFTVTRTGGEPGSTNNTATIINNTGGGETPVNNNTIANPITKL
ncbi:hypothetical protein [Siphonobacter curvatus]|uniref:DUF11 domain-containing protein n=1 Tax=Siphonobacter curvatus TaxID=2094562 RepID=A0A2S7IID7_9BACT|nr:hypothetical protein [Siphonobacter curvatus]PQA56091.1 hypothetical protein C5O19_17175 [Siphonobacter curvatus]